MFNEQELKPCPFCGGDAYIKLTHGNFWIDCFHNKDCLIKTNTWLYSSHNIKEQIEKWNRRRV